MKALRWIIPVLVVLLVGGALAWYFYGRFSPPRVERYIPSEAIVYVHYQGLEKASRSFRGTALSEMLNEEEMKAFREEFSRFLADQVARGSGSMPLKWDDIRMFFDFEIGVGLYDSGVSTPDVVVAIDPGSRAEDLRGIVESLRKYSEKSGRTLKTREIEGIEATGWRPGWSVWFGDVLVFASG